MIKPISATDNLSFKGTVKKNNLMIQCVSYMTKWDKAEFSQCLQAAKKVNDGKTFELWANNVQIKGYDDDIWGNNTFMYFGDKKDSLEHHNVTLGVVERIYQHTVYKNSIVKSVLDKLKSVYPEYSKEPTLEDPENLLV